MVSAATLILVVLGLGLLGYSLVLGEDAIIPRAVSTATKGEELAASAPKDTMLKLTIPKMARVEDLPIYDDTWNGQTALDVSAAHLDSSGFPWQEGANVYISGHRMGFPGTKSFLVFYDLDKLENGDEVILTDSNDTKYTYKVFNKYEADPYDWDPTKPISGKNVVTLQTCTLPDYVRRLIVQAELTKTTPDDSSSQDKPAEPTTPSQPEPAQGPVPAEPAAQGPDLAAPVGGPGPVEPAQDADLTPVGPLQAG